MTIQQMMLRPSGPAVALFNKAISNIASNVGGAVSAYLRLASSGAAFEQGATSITYPGEWLRSGTAGEFQMRWSPVSGVTPNINPGTQGVWYSLSSDRDIGLSTTVNNSERFSVVLVEISRVADGIPLVSSEISIQVTKGTPV